MTVMVAGYAPAAAATMLQAMLLQLQPLLPTPLQMLLVLPVPYLGKQAQEQMSLWPRWAHLPAMVSASGDVIMMREEWSQWKLPTGARLSPSG